MVCGKNEITRRAARSSAVLPFFLLVLLLAPALRPGAEEGALDLSFTSPAGRRRLTAGEESSFRLEVKNTGARAIADITISALAPQEWRLEITPERLPSLNPGKISGVMVAVTPPRRAEETYYSLTFHVRSEAGDESLSVSLWVETPRGRWLTVALILTVAVLAAFIAVFIRISGRE
jgi:uncharacterized membrane protein